MNLLWSFCGMRIPLAFSFYDRYAFSYFIFLTSSYISYNAFITQNRRFVNDSRLLLTRLPSFNFSSNYTVMIWTQHQECSQKLSGQTRGLKLKLCDYTIYYNFSSAAESVGQNSTRVRLRYPRNTTATRVFMS